VLATNTQANIETDRTETAIAPAQHESASQAQPADDPVKATPPRAEGIEGAPTPLIPDQPLPAEPAKTAPARKLTRKAGRAAPGPTGATSAQLATSPDAEAQPTPSQRTPIPAAKASDKAEASSESPARQEPAKATDDDRTGAKPIPPSEKPADEPAEQKDKPADEKRTGAEPIPAADQHPQDQAPQQRHKETRIVPTRPPAVQPPARTPALAEATASRTEPWAKLVADPGHAPELLALAAVQTIGPRAAEWARQHREAYPQATDDALARLAVAQFTRFGSVGSVFAAVAGSYAPIALLGSNALTYAEIVLHVAAAYGQDPTDRQRAVDLLVLAQVHPSREDAEAALATAEQPTYEEETRLTDAVWRLGRMVAAQAAAWTVLRGLNRFLPGTTMLAAIMTSRNGARTMGGKATAYYRARR
jgi:hypothetical protein